jgi:ABC-2 type transport system ATP-binding protein
MMAALQQVPPMKPRSLEVEVAGLRGVTKTYGDIKALNNVDFSVRAGELVALLGPNGAGKTTAVKLLLGVAAPTAGTVNVFGGNPVNPGVRMRTEPCCRLARFPKPCAYASTSACFPPTI